MEWFNNPTFIEYKLDNQSNVNTFYTSQIKGFEILNKSKYIKQKINVEITSNNLNNLEYKRVLNLEEREILLKELVTGSANLYEYRQGEILNYFYNTEKNPIKLLEYKAYLVDDKTMGYNKNYQQELLNNLTCGDLSINDFQKLEYKYNTLSRVFEKYNKCKNPNQIINKKESENPFNVWIKTRGNFSKTEINNGIALQNYNYESNLSFGIGLELEYVLPFNNKQWSLFIEPNYVGFNSEKTNGDQKLNLEYKSIEAPIGIRYGYFISPKSKIYANVAYVVSFDLGSKFIVDNPTHYTDYEIELKSNPSAAFGIGYVYNNRWGIEFRTSTSKNITKNIQYWSSSYNLSSIILSYRIF